MQGVSLESAVTKLAPVPFRALEAAYLFARTRGDAFVELAHWLNHILLQPDSDLHHILRASGLDLGRVTADLAGALEKVRRGSGSYLDYADGIIVAIERGWLTASLQFNAPEVRSGHLLVGLLEEDRLRRELEGLSAELRKLSAETLRRDFARILAGSPEERTASAPAGAPAATVPATGIAGGLDDAARALERFTVDLTAQARSGELDPVRGRDDEIRQLIDILMRRRQNNPILVGEAGVGKTAIVEGFAHRIANGDVPPSLKEVALRVLDVGLLQAGASMKGEFENRLRQVVEAVQRSAQPIVLFIDEAHTLIGAGGAAGTGDAANLLKPALARGTLRTIAATTWGEYKEFIEPDPALARRFQPIKVEEPDHGKAVRMLRGVAGVLASHHKVDVLDEAVNAAVSLSRRYISARQLPDKGVSVLDTACARVAVSQAAAPAELEDKRRDIEAVEAELAVLEREARVGRGDVRRTDEAMSHLQQLRTEQVELEARWTIEKELVEAILRLRTRLVGTEAIDPADPAGREELGRLERKLAALQGERPLILPAVDRQAVALVIADWTGIPLGRMVKDEIDQVLGLADTLKARIIGQDHALDSIARRIQTSRAGLDNPEKPVGVFLLVGTSGVGKTETALALAEVLFGGEQNLIGINMSEFQEAHTVSTLKGAPPGYKGYGKGGRLTEAVRRKPYSVVLLDEIEKAHPDVHEIFFQVFDKGVMEDSEGRRIDFRNTLILLTSNVGSDLLMKLCADPDTLPEPGALGEALRPKLLEVFPAALLGRLVVVPYFPLTDEVLGRIIRLQLDRIAQRVQDQHAVPFTYDGSVVALTRRRCSAVESGGRMIDAILTQTLLPDVSREILKRRRDGRAVEAIAVNAEGDHFVYRFEKVEAD